MVCQDGGGLLVPNSIYTLYIYLLYTNRKSSPHNSSVSVVTRTTLIIVLGVSPVSKVSQHSQLLSPVMADTRPGAQSCERLDHDS